MTDSITISYDPIFNYSEFLESGVTWDCKIVFPDGNEMKCHKIVLSNSSKFFFNAFTGDMSEQVTGVVNISYNPGNLLADVIKWMYDGKISKNIYENKLMELYAIVHFYGVDVLKEKVEEKIKESVNINNIFDYINKCYDDDLQESLNILAPIIGEHINEYNVDKLSDALDVRVYSLVLKASKLSDSEKLNHMKNFIKSYEMNSEEKQMLRDSLTAPENNSLIKSIFPDIL